MKIEKVLKQERFKSEFQKLTLNIMVTNNWLGEKANDILKPYDLTPKQFNVLRILRGQRPNPITVREIRNRMIDKMSDVSRIIERLRKKGLITRQICDDNRRAVDVLITDNGMKLLKELDVIDDLLKESLKNISVKEAQIVNEILDKIRSH
jgi:DNA-binding MarR family transcriptional regulator